MPICAIFGTGQRGGTQELRYDELNPEYFLPKKQGILVPYLDMIQKDLDTREE